MISIEYLRHYRLFGYAIFDLALSFLGMALLAPWLTKMFRKLGIEIPLLSWVWFTLPISILVHILFGRMTPMVTQFLDIHGNFLLKIVIAGCFVAGVIPVRRVHK